MKKHRIIMVAGFTDKNTATIWGGSEIETHTSFNPQDFDFGQDAEKELENCKNFIKQKEETEGWIPGYVTCYMNEIDITETIQFYIQGNHDSHRGEALVVSDYNEGTSEMLNQLPGKMNDLKTNLIGSFNGYKIYENYYDSGSDDYGYFAVKSE